MGTEMSKVSVMPNPADEFMPIMNIEQATQRQQQLVAYVKRQMIEGKDFGTIPGASKPCLYKPGAEKLATFFGLTTDDPEELVATEDWTGAAHNGEPFFYYKIRQRLSRNGRPIAAQFASCNSWETKYRYRWVPEADVPLGLDLDRLARRDGSISEPDFAIKKGETSGKYGKPAEYWQRFRDAIAAGEAREVRRQTKAGKDMLAWEIGATVYRVPNEELPSLVNTIQKMAQKRAFVAAVIIAVNASEFFTQDMEDMQPGEVPNEPARPAARPGQAASAELKRQVSEWQKKFDECETAKCFNELFSKLGILEASVKRGVWEAMKASTKAKGILWNPDASQFVDPVPVAPEREPGVEEEAA